MPWFKVDDRMPSNKKVVLIPRRRRPSAIGLWTMLGAWCSDNLTDGYIPETMVEEMGGTQRMVDDLCDVAGLWVRVDGGYQHLKWAEYQPTRENVEEKRDEARERMARRRAELRERSREQSRTSDELHENFARSSQGVRSPRPDPSRKDKETTSPTERGALAAVADSTAQGLVTDWIDALPARPPGAVVGQIAKRVGALIGEGIPHDDVRRGLQAWQTKGLHPSALDSVVHEIRTAGTFGTNGKTRRQAETDQQFDQMLAEARERDQHQPPRKAINT